MKPIRWLPLFLTMLVLGACSHTSVNGTPQPGFSLFPTTKPLPTAVVGITHAPDPEAAMQNFLAALKNNDYAAMYAQLSKASRAALTAAVFGIGSASTVVHLYDDATTAAPYERKTTDENPARQHRAADRPRRS